MGMFLCHFLFPSLDLSDDVVCSTLLDSLKLLKRISHIHIYRKFISNHGPVPLTEEETVMACWEFNNKWALILSIYLGVLELNKN